MRLPVFIVLAALFHLALIFFFWLFTFPSVGPLAGGTGVSVEIMSDLPLTPSLVRRGERVEAPSPPSGEGRDEGREGPGAGNESGSDSLLAQIRSRIERAKHYPLLAKKSGLEGRSLVRFQIDENGEPTGITLKNSSGSPLLDDESMSTIRRAAPFPLYGIPLEVWIKFEIGRLP